MVVATWANGPALARPRSTAYTAAPDAAVQLRVSEVCVTEADARPVGAAVGAGVVGGVPPVSFPFVKLPWQYVDEQELPFHACGVAPRLRASVPYVIGVVPFAWVLSPAAGSVPWHSEQAMGAARSVLWLTCDAWAPTAVCVVTLSPPEPIGGAAATRASAPATAVGVALPSKSQDKVNAPTPPIDSKKTYDLTKNQTLDIEVPAK